MFIAAPLSRLTRPMQNRERRLNRRLDFLGDSATIVAYPLKSLVGGRVRRKTSVLACMCLAAAPPPFAYIQVDGMTLRSTNGIALEVRAPAGYRLFLPASRIATFGGHPYEVTLAGFGGTADALMFHAERVADGSGASNYDNLPESPWPGFRLRSQCVAIAAEDLAEEHDIKWLADRGWNPVGNLALEQHLKSTADHNREVVVSLLARVKDCSDKQEVGAARDRIRREVKVTPL
jgi:hypothetical protein